MGALREGVIGSHGVIEGVTLREYAEPGDDAWVAPTLADRKDHMLRVSDAVLVLPGGLGTLDELLHTLSMQKDHLGGFDSDVVLLDADGYWSEVIRALDRLDPSATPLMTVVKNVSSAISALERRRRKNRV